VLARARSSEHSVSQQSIAPPVRRLGSKENRRGLSDRNRKIDLSQVEVVDRLLRTWMTGNVMSNNKVKRQSPLVAALIAAAATIIVALIDKLV